MTKSTKQAKSDQVLNIRFDYYDRATNQVILPNTIPMHCIDPVGSVKIYTPAGKFAALVNLNIRGFEFPYKRTFREWLLRRKPQTHIVQLFDLDRAHNELEAAVNEFEVEQAGSTTPLPSENSGSQRTSKSKATEQLPEESSK